MGISRIGGLAEGGNMSEGTGVAAASGIPSLEKPRLLFFYSRRSGHCRRVEGFLAQVLQRRQNHETFVVHRIDSDERPDLVDRFRVEELPTLLIVDGRRVRARLARPKGCRDIETLLKPWLNGNSAGFQARSGEVGTLPGRG
jgi:thioredoxin family protein